MSDNLQKLQHNQKNILHGIKYNLGFEVSTFVASPPRRLWIKKSGNPQTS